MLPVLLVAMAWSLFGSGAHVQQRLAFHTSTSPDVRIVSLNGAITIVAGNPGSGVAVVVTKRADSLAEAQALTVAVDRRGDAVTLRAVYPDGCSRSCSGEISFAVTVPPGAVIDASTANGSVKATGIGGDVRLASSNGSVRASYDSVARVRSIWLGTRNGSVDLALPAAARVGRLHMETSLGRVRSDWPVDVDRTNFVGGSVDQTVHAGGFAVSLTTANGSVSLEKR